MRPSLPLLAAYTLAAASLGCDADTKSALAPTAAPATLAAADDGVRVYQFRTEEDPAVTGANEFCAKAPFTANVKLNASMYSVRTRASDARVVNQDAKRVGTALACARLTTNTFPPGLDQEFYARFDLPGGSYTGVGTCKLISNNVPRTGIVLAGCSLKLTQVPAGVIGGAAVSLSVFNPAGIPGFTTGSQWTIQAYEQQ